MPWREHSAALRILVDQLLLLLSVSVCKCTLAIKGQFRYWPQFVPAWVMAALQGKGVSRAHGRPF